MKVSLNPLNHSLRIQTINQLCAYSVYNTQARALPKMNSFNAYQGRPCQRSKEFW